MPVKSGVPTTWTKHGIAATFQAMVDERHRARGQEVTRLRDLKGWSQETLAHEAKTSIGTISRLELGKVEARGSTLRNVAGSLGVPVESLTVSNLADADPVPQLDRIEGKLDAILAALATPLTPEQIVALAQADRQATDKPDSSDPSAPRKPGKGQAA